MQMAGKAGVLTFFPFFGYQSEGFLLPRKQLPGGCYGMLGLGTQAFFAV
jgi:hypothetical protein